METVTTRIQVKDLEHLKELADGSDGEPPVECVLVLIAGKDITLVSRFWVQYCESPDEDAWYLDQEVPGQDHYSEEEFKDTGVALAIQKGELYVEEEREVDLFVFAVDVTYEGVADICTRNGLTNYRSSDWDEILIQAASVKCQYITKDQTIIMFLQSGDALHFSEMREVNYPPEVSFFDWVKVYVPVTSSSS